MKFKTQAHKISFDYQNHFHKDMCKHTRARWSCLLNMSIFVLKRATTEKMPQSRAGSMEGSTEGCLLPQVVFHWRLSSNKGCLPIKVIFHWRSSSTEGRHPLKVVFHQSLSSTYHNTLWEQSTYQISASYLQCMIHYAWCLMHAIYWGSLLTKNIAVLNIEDMNSK